MWKMAGFTWQVLKRLIGLGCFVVVVMGLLLWGLSRTTRLMGMGGPRLVGGGMGFGRVVVMAGLLCLGVAQSALAALGVEAPMQEIGTEFWGTVIPVALGVTAAMMLLVAWLMHHAGLFIAIVVMAVVIFSIGFGIPALMQSANLNWFF